LEYNMPTVEVALQKMKNVLTTNKGLGCKAVILIHGYGSSGVGGSIKAAVTRCLSDNSMRGIVRAYVGGE
jgi:DNA-nicking Smr family endonuclease